MAKAISTVKRKKNSSRKTLKSAPSLLQLTGLNDDCLKLIFDRMDVVSLARMSKACDRFYDIITSRIIPYRTIDFSTFSKTYNVRKMFAIFGKSMTRIIVNQDDIRIVSPGYSELAEFLRMLIEFGEPGKLKDVSLEFRRIVYEDLATIQKLWQDARPFFANVCKLQIDLIGFFSDRFSGFIINAFDPKMLRELIVHNANDVSEWLSANVFVNLQKFHLCLTHDRFYDQAAADALNESCLTGFISGKLESLISFECINAPSETVFVELSRHHPSIERVGGLKYWSNGNNGSGAGISYRDYKENWQYFNAFTHLKDVSLRSSTVNFSDSGEAFSILAKHQTVEQLKLTFGRRNENLDNPVKITDLKRLTRLKTLFLNNFHDKLSKELVNALFAHLPALTTCTIDGKHPIQGRIIELIGLAKNLKVLKFTDSFPTFSVYFYKKLLKLRAPPYGQEADETNRLTIYIDDENAHACVQKLRKRYKPNIIMLRTN